MSGDSECERTDPIRDYCLSAASLVWFFRSMTGNSTTANQEGAMLRSGFEQAYTEGQLLSILIWTFFQPVFWNCPHWMLCLFMWHSDGLESFLGVTPPSPDGFWDWLQLRPQSVECLTVNDQLCRDLFDLYKCWQTKRTNTFHFFLFGKTVILLRIKIKVSNFSELWGQSCRTDRTQRTLAGVSGCALRPLSITP